MVRHSVRAWGLALALTVTGALISGCAGGPTAFQAAPIDPAAEAQYHELSPVANLDTHDLTYRGPLPPNLVAVDGKVNEVGDPTYLSTEKAIAQFGEPRVRKLVVQDAKLCGRVGIQRLALNDLRRQSDAVAASRERVHNRRNAILAAGAASEVGGTVLAGVKYGWNYGGIMALGSLLPSLGNQYVYKMVLDQGDMEAALWLAQGRFWYNQNDFWLDAMDTWCPAYMSWLGSNGQIVHEGS